MIIIWNFHSGTKLSVWIRHWWWIYRGVHRGGSPIDLGQGCRKQHWTMFCCQHCSMLSTILFSIVTPDRRLIQAQQYWTIWLTTLNNAGSKTLFNAVFNSPEQVVRFLLCMMPSSARFVGFVLGFSSSTLPPIKPWWIHHCSLTLDEVTFEVTSKTFFTVRVLRMNSVVLLRLLWIRKHRHRRRRQVLGQPTVSAFWLHCFASRAIDFSFLQIS